MINSCNLYPQHETTNHQRPPSAQNSFLFCPKVSILLAPVVVLLLGTVIEQQILVSRVEAEKAETQLRFLTKEWGWNDQRKFVSINNDINMRVTWAWPTSAAIRSGNLETLGRNWKPAWRGAGSAWSGCSAALNLRLLKQVYQCDTTVTYLPC